MKKILAIAITILVILTAVAPQAQAQDKKKMDQLQKELITLEQKMATGKATQADFTRYQEVGIEMLMLQNPSLTRAQAQTMQQQMMQTEMLPEVETKSSRQFESQISPEEKRRDQLGNDYAAGKISLAEYQRRLYATDGWPTAQAMSRFGNKVTKPSGNYNFTYILNGEELNITIGKTNGQNITQTEARELYNHFLVGYGAPVADFLNGGWAMISFPDPKLKEASNVIEMEVRYEKNGGAYFTIKMYPNTGHSGN